MTFPAAAAAAACSGTSGVTVVVDFGPLGGGVITRCAPGDPSSGLDALTGAGFSYSFVPRQPGLVCQINALPNPCNGAPTDAYWAYWHAKRGGSWTYSSTGAGTYNPAPGTVEGWAFGASRTPSVAPPPVPAPSPTRTTTAPRPTTTSRSGGTGSTSGGHTPAGPTAAPGAAASPSVSVLGTKTGATPLSPTRSPAHVESADPATPGATTAEPPESGGTGPPAPLVGLAGLVLVGGIGGAAWWRARRHVGAR